MSKSRVVFRLQALRIVRLDTTRRELYEKALGCKSKLGTTRELR